MRPLKLTLNCFGPFLSETVDFTKLGDDLFLISGPTGSGKTTIFDGISYALFGEASSPDRLADGMKSDFADVGNPCFVELTFSVGPKIYHIHRLPHQMMMNHLNTGHKEQKHEAHLWAVAPDGTETLIASSVRECAQTIKAILGLSASQFRQIVMLPQGQFSRLLKSTEKERVDLLKTLFAMDYYKSFERKVEAAAQEADGDSEKLKQQIIQEIRHLMPGKDTALQAAIEAKDPNPTTLLPKATSAIARDQAALSQLRNEIDLLSGRRETLARELGAGIALIARFDSRDAAQKKDRSLAEQKEAMAALQRKITFARKARAIRPIERNLEREQSRKVRTQTLLDEQQAILKDATQNQQALAPQLAESESPAYEAAIEADQKSRNALEGHLHSLADWADLDAKIDENRKHLQSMEIRIGGITKLKTAQTEEGRAITELQQQLTDTQKELMTADEKLTRARLQLDEINRLGKMLDAIAANDKQLLQLRKDEKTLQKDATRFGKELIKLEARQLRNAAGALAATLREGDPCPVCGNVHHPEPAASADALGSLQEKLNNARASVSESQGSLTALREQITFYTKQNAEQSARMDALQAEKPFLHNVRITKHTIDQQTVVLTGRLQELSTLRHHLNEKTTRQTDALTKRQKAYEENQRVIDASGDLQTDYTACKSRLDSQAGALGLIKTRLSVLPDIGDLETQSPKALSHLFKDKQTRLSRRIQEKQDHRKALRLQKDKLAQKAAAAKAAATSAQKSLEDATRSLASVQREYDAALLESQLTRTCYDQHKNLSLEQLAGWEKDIAGYNQTVAVTRDNLKNLNAELQGKTRPDLSEKQKEKNRYDIWENKLNAHFQMTQMRVTTNEKQIDTLKDLDAALKKAKARQALLSDLNHTIKGTVAGCQKLSFERFILSAYLQDILVSANVFLDDISDGRYHLMLAEDPEQKDNRGLSIEVYDDFTGKSRAASSLSGGETFMAALSMALGLSDMVQSRAGGISLDTLFIDEGFATLDTNSLAKAMDCLTRLQRKGRTVGIISHVSELRELVDAKILVEKTEAGSYIQVQPR